MKHLMFLIKILLLLSIIALPEVFAVESTLAAGSQTSVSAPAAITLTITNPLPKDTTISLTGRKEYTIFVPKGATITKTIEPGKYKFTYPGCLGKTKKGNLKVKRDSAALNIAACKMATWYFYNADDTVPATISFRGWVNYTLVVPPRQIQVFSLVADTYEVSLRACGKSYADTLKVKGRKRVIIYACD